MSMPPQLCTSCQKQPASVHVLDLAGGVLSGAQHLCQACAEQNGVVHPKVMPTKPMTAEIFDVLGSLTSEKARGRARGAGVSCPGCGTTLADFKTRGRFGCPRCYEVFRTSLLPLLERVHDAPRHRGRFPARTVAPRVKSETVAELRKRLESAILGEKYEEAASLRDQLRDLEQSGQQP